MSADKQPVKVTLHEQEVLPGTQVHKATARSDGVEDPDELTAQDFKEAGQHFKETLVGTAEKAREMLTGTGEPAENQGSQGTESKEGTAQTVGKSYEQAKKEGLEKVGEMQGQTADAFKQLEEDLTPKPDENKEDPEVGEFRDAAAEVAGSASRFFKGEAADESKDTLKAGTTVEQVKEAAKDAWDRLTSSHSASAKEVDCARPKEVLEELRGEYEEAEVQAEAELEAARKRGHEIVGEVLESVPLRAQRLQAHIREKKLREEQAAKESGSTSSAMEYFSSAVDSAKSAVQSVTGSLPSLPSFPSLPSLWGSDGDKSNESPQEKESWTDWFGRIFEREPSDEKSKQSDVLVLTTVGSAEIRRVGDLRSIGYIPSNTEDILKFRAQDRVK